MKSDTNNIQNVKIQFFFRKGFACEFLSAFFCFKKLFFKRNLNQQREFKALNFISRRDSVCDVVSEIKFLSQVRILFSQSSLKMNSDLVFTHFWSGFSFFFTHSKSWSLFRSVIFDAISHNGKGLCEVRATANRKSGGEPISSKNFFHFLKLRKN